MNTPEGLAIDAGSNRVYVASQSGYGEDPVFVIDTISDSILQAETITGMAVGASVAVSPKHNKLYVARANFPFNGGSRELRPAQEAEGQGGEVSILPTESGLPDVSRSETLAEQKVT